MPALVGGTATSTDTNSSTALSTNLITAALDKAIGFELRSMPLHRGFVDKRPTDLTNPGEVVTWNKYTRLTPTTAELDEVVEPNATEVPKTTPVSATLKEYGRVVVPTLKLRTVTFADIDPGVARIVADDMADSLDVHVRTVMNAGTNRVSSDSEAVSTQATNTLTTGDDISSAIVRYVTAKMRAASVVPWKDNLFGALIAPDVAHDLRAETGSGGWRYPHEYTSNAEIWAGEIGTYEGAFFIESPRAFSDTDGATSHRVFRTLFLGREGVAEATAVEPRSGISENYVDLLNRTKALFWYGLLGWARYREEALYRVETASSITAR